MSILGDLIFVSFVGGFTAGWCCAVGWGIYVERERERNRLLLFNEICELQREREDRLRENHEP